MRYYKELGEELVENGTAKLKGATIQLINHPQRDDRMVRIFAVQSVVRQSDTNPIEEGALLGLSIPKANINARDYTWKRDEEKMTPLKIELR